jgi:hypothetical protein
MSISVIIVILASFSPELVAHWGSSWIIRVASAELPSQAKIQWPHLVGQKKHVTCEHKKSRVDMTNASSTINFCQSWPQEQL